MMEKTLDKNEEREDWAGISDVQLYLFNEGTNYKSYKMLGSHLVETVIDGESKKGFRFAVWAPNAKSVSLVGDFNEWDSNKNCLEKIGTTGVWYGFFADIKDNVLYKYAIQDKNGKITMKSDPYANYAELRPNTASITREISDYAWKDKKWISKREKTPPYSKPMLVYEVHIGSWRIHENGDFYTYRELAQTLIPYVKDLGYTHIELMPLMEYPYDGSWGYQVTGFFAPTSRYGTPEDLKYFVDTAHSMNIGVIMDWVPAHFPRDEHGLAKFDGSCSYEYEDTRLGEHKEWGTLVFDYSKSEVVSFLISSAYFWVEEYHFDGLRVDAVSSMLYRDYDRNRGEWIPNIYGGNQNLEAIKLLQNLNKIMFANFPNILMIAEESTSWGLVTGSAHEGGLGFNYKWNMGWMNDTLRYMSMDPFFRSSNHNLLTFVMFYAFTENFILPLSHDEVVHGKGSLLNKMYGDYDEKFNSYRALIAYYLSLPGKKLLFMGGELGQFTEWKFDGEVEWNLLEFEKHNKLHKYIKDINCFYLNNKPFWEIEGSWDGFKWINDQDNQNSVLTYMRKGKSKSDYIIVVSNFTPVTRKKYIVGVPYCGEYEVVVNSDAVKYGGKTRNYKKTYKAVKKQMMEMPYSIEIDVAELSTIYLKKKKTVRTSSQKAKLKEIDAKEKNICLDNGNDKTKSVKNKKTTQQKVKTI